MQVGFFSPFSLFFYTSWDKKPSVSCLIACNVCMFSVCACVLCLHNVCVSSKRMILPIFHDFLGITLVAVVRVKLVKKQQTIPHTYSQSMGRL